MFDYLSKSLTSRNLTPVASFLDRLAADLELSHYPI